MSSSTSSSEARPVRRFLLRIALPFLAVMIPACWGFDVWFTERIILSTEPEGATKLNRLFHSTDPSEIVCIGNSRINNGLNPDSLSPQAYNYGMNGANYSLLEMAIRKELGSVRKTPLIVGVDVNFFNNEVNNSVYTVPLYAEFPEARAFMREVGEGHIWHYIPTVRYFGKYEWYTQRYLSAQHPEYTGCHYLRGASLCTRSFDPTLLDKIKGDTFIIHPNPAYLSRFYRLLAEFPHRQIVLVRLPFHPTYAKAVRQDGNLLFFVEQVQLLPHVKLIDLNDGRLGEECFTDLSHMNEVGANAFSGELRHALDSLGIKIE